MSNRVLDIEELIRVSTAKCVEEHRSAGLNLFKSRRSFKPECEAYAREFYADALAQAKAGEYQTEDAVNEAVSNLASGFDPKLFGILAVVVIAIIIVIIIFNKNK